MNVSLVPHGAVAGLIPALMPFLVESEQWSHGRAKVDDLLRFVLNGQMHLWVVHDQQSLYGHLITEIKHYPQCKMLTVQYCAMQENLMDMVEDEMQSKAAQFAKDAGCAGIEFVGRPGWRKAANKYGYEVQSVMYQKFF